MMSSGPRSGFLLSTFALVTGLRFAVAAWKIIAPEPGTDASPRPARIMVSSPPKECPMTAGFPRQPADHLGVPVGDLLDRLAGEELGLRPRLLDRLGIVRPPGRQYGVAGGGPGGARGGESASQRQAGEDGHEQRAAG